MAGTKRGSVYNAQSWEPVGSPYDFHLIRCRVTLVRKEEVDAVDGRDCETTPGK